LIKERENKLEIRIDIGLGLNQTVKIIEYNNKYCEDTILMWRESKENALSREEIHSFSNQKKYFNEILIKNNSIYIVLLNEKVIGMIAFNEKEINQLYIHKDYQDMGIGKKLLNIAKNKSTGILTLYTFEINCKAQKFYERNGFKIIRRNYENEEKLNDIKYEWNK
jgi:ribosomal protein S18 acetylase RimI-like enzyme